MATSAATPLWRARSCRLWNTACEVVGSRLPVGSSQSSRRGLLASARATATRCCSPPESCAGWWVSRSARPSSLEQLPGPRLGRRAATCRRSSAAGRRCRAPRAPAAGGGTGRRSRSRAAGCGCGRGRTASSSPRRRSTMVPAVGCSSRPAACSSDDLPEPDGPIRPTSSPGIHLQVDALQHLQRPLAGDVGALQPADDEDRVTHSEAPRPDRAARRARPDRASPANDAEQREDGDDRPPRADRPAPARWREEVDLRR